VIAYCGQLTSPPRSIAVARSASVASAFAARSGPPRRIDDALPAMPWPAPSGSAISPYRFCRHSDALALPGDARQRSWIRRRSACLGDPTEHAVIACPVPARRSDMR
jgi:hypothetical protein